jgi:hypothetical protein
LNRMFDTIDMYIEELRGVKTIRSKIRYIYND